MLAVFFLSPRSEQVYVSVSIFKVHSGVTLLLQSLCRGCRRCSGVGQQAGLSSTPRVHPSPVGVALGILPFYSTAGQPEPKDNCIFGKTLTGVSFGVHNSTAACEGLEEVAVSPWVSGSWLRPRPRWQPEHVWLSVCLGQA